jgi:hypothetical protein
MVLTRVFRTHSWPGQGPFRPQRFVPVQGPIHSGDNASHTWTLAGFTYTITGMVVSNATVNVFRTDTNILTATTTSGSNGSWAVQMPSGGFTYYVTAYLTDSPDLAGITVNTLTPV